MAFGSKNSTPSFVLTLPMVISLNEQDLLYKEFKKCGIIYNQLVYSAFLLEHIDTESLQYNMETLNSAFPAFLGMHENTKQRLQAVGSSLPASIGF